ncbi:NUDIX hydrolase [Halorhodospira abdelmalekii]|nr:NUDIX hydrolase [Halorhodospira abdelmalekii]
MAARPPRPRRKRSKRRTLSAGVVPIRFTEGGAHLYLMLRAFQYWDFPKGKVEPGEEPLTAAHREVEEETGITELDFRWGYDFFETGPYAHGKVARYYLAHTTTRRVVFGINPELGRPEHHEHRWTPFAEAYQLASPRVREVLDWAEAKLTESKE